MKKIIFVAISALVLVNCGTDKKKDKEGIKEELLEAPTAENKQQIHIKEDYLEQSILDFQNCKAKSEERSDCRNTLAKYINYTYNIKDFKDKNNKEVVYDSIQPIILKSSKWKSIGLATIQENLDKALMHANKGKLALIIDTSKTYGHVVVVQPGESKKSGSWALKLPKVLSLSNHNPSKSFSDKTLAYAFKKSDDLQVFIRE